ncbi:hypothetical protein ACPV3S_17130 [Photobacterium damselae]|uniref:hypothetical protein n=1 Tax=Photobacterium damselae TaxID=38293 RepID=UPI0040686828
MRFFLLIICIIPKLALASFAIERPITWSKSSASLDSSMTIDSFNQLPKYSIISSDHILPNGVYLHINNVQSSVRIGISGAFPEGSIVANVPSSVITNSLQNRRGNVNIYRLNEYLGIVYQATFRSQNDVYTQDANSSMLYLPYPFAKLYLYDGITITIVKLKNISNPFKTIKFVNNYTGVFGFYSGASTLVSPTMSLDLNIVLNKVNCGITLDKSLIDFGTITDSLLLSGNASKNLFISSTCPGNSIPNVKVELLNAYQGVISSSDNSIKFNIYKNDGNLFSQPLLLNSDLSKYKLSIQAKENNSNSVDYLGNKSGRVNIKFTYS